nr:transposase [Prauserella muralis]
MFLAYTTPRGRALVDRELDLPKSWIADRERCRAAAIPDEIEFATKTTLAKAMLARAFAAGVPARWVTADEAYGQDHKFRSWMEQHHIGYVVAVPRNQALPAGGFATARADQLVAQAPPESWKRRSAGNGAKGPRLYDLAAATVPTIGEHTPGRLDPPTPRPPSDHLRWSGTRTGLLPVLRPRHHSRRGIGARRRRTLGHRGVLPDRQDRSRSRSLPGPTL